MRERVMCPSLSFSFVLFDVTGFFILIEYVVCSVLIEHMQHFEPHVGCSQWDSAL